VEELSGGGEGGREREEKRGVTRGSYNAHLNQFRSFPQKNLQHRY
jgi:hypothetical protein